MARRKLKEIDINTYHSDFPPSCSNASRIHGDSSVACRGAEKSSVFHTHGTVGECRGYGYCHGQDRCAED